MWLHTVRCGQRHKVIDLFIFFRDQLTVDRVSLPNYVSPARQSINVNGGRARFVGLAVGVSVRQGAVAAAGGCPHFVAVSGGGFC